MQAVGTRDTGPELTVRRLLHRIGYRFRLQAKELPGRPDVVFRRRRKAIFVHGCFWHGHGCEKGRLPMSRQEFWAPKISANKARDRDAVAALEAEGWGVLTLWQCETHDMQNMERLLRGFLGPRSGG